MKPVREVRDHQFTEQQAAGIVRDALMPTNKDSRVFYELWGVMLERDRRMFFEISIDGVTSALEQELEA